MYRLLLVVLFLDSCLDLYSQEVEDKKSTFPLFELNKGDDDTKNLNWGNFHFINESYRKAAARFSKVKNPSVDIKRKTAKAYIDFRKIEIPISIKYYANPIEFFISF